MDTIIETALSRIKSKGEEYTCKELEKEFGQMWKEAEDVMSGKKKCPKGMVIFYKGKFI